MYFREIGQKSSEELAREGSGVKAFSSFLSELGTLVPETMIPNISVLLAHLEGEVLLYMFFFALPLSLFFAQWWDQGECEPAELDSEPSCAPIGW